MPVDSFKFLPRIIATFYQMTERRPRLPIPWTPLPRPLSGCTFGLVTSGGLYQQGVEPPFDVDREKQEPAWGDPTYRRLPVDVTPSAIGVSHLHLNSKDILEDVNILLPVTRFQELLVASEIGGLARHAYSFMGYQGFPPDTTAWEHTYGPQVAQALLDEGADCVLLTPA
jgi:D-proline reductase (dithiol) PrdB